VLTLFASLADPSWPATRAGLVLGPLLCNAIVPPPLLKPRPDPARSIRQQMIELTAPDGCMVCHKLLNGPGFAFIGFDSFGRWHPEAGFGPGETAGWMPEEIMPGAPDFENLSELAHLLARR